jgi:hypothetical protein
MKLVPPAEDGLLRLRITPPKNTRPQQWDGNEPSLTVGVHRETLGSRRRREP